MEIKIKKLHPNARMPEYATDGSGCFDLFAAELDHDSNAHGTTECAHWWQMLIVGTGIAVEVPAGHVMLIFSRSGDGFKRDVRLANCVGVIDSDYRGEIKIKLACDNKRYQTTRVGDRIAQAMIIPIPRAQFTQIDELSATDRGDGGFGSTGR